MRRKKHRAFCTAKQFQSSNGNSVRTTPRCSKNGSQLAIDGKSERLAAASLCV
jgi:hypothetical protein